MTQPTKSEAPRQPGLDELTEAMRRPMTADEQREQRRSFVYGNTSIDNDRITREMVDEVDRRGDGVTTPKP